MPSPQAAVILVHGATLNGRSWDPVRRLVDPRLQVLAPDLPGHGARRNETYSLQGAVDTVLAAARALGDAPFILAGDSLGSYTSQAAAASLPQDRLKGLVLGGATHEFIGAPVLPYAAKALVFRVLLPLMGEDKLIERKIPATLRECGMLDTDIKATMAAGISLRVFPQAVQALRGVRFRARLAQIAQPTSIPPTCAAKRTTSPLPVRPACTVSPAASTASACAAARTTPTCSTSSHAACSRSRCHACSASIGMMRAWAAATAAASGGEPASSPHSAGSAQKAATASAAPQTRCSSPASMAWSR